jgi:hypothetical protein
LNVEPGVGRGDNQPGRSLHLARATAGRYEQRFTCQRGPKSSYLLRAGYQGS